MVQIKKIIYLVFTALILVAVVTALLSRRNAFIDGKRYTADTIQVRNYFKTANHYLYELKNSPENTLKAQGEVLKAFRLSKRANYGFGEGESYLMLSNIYKAQGKENLAVLHTRKAIKLFTAAGDNQKIADGYAQLGWFYDAYSDEIFNRITYHDSAQKYYGLSGDKVKQANILLDLADCYTLQKDWLRSERILRNVLALYKESNHKDVQGVYDLLNQNSVFLGKYDDALRYGKKALQVALQVGDTSLQFCTIKNRLGLAYHCLEDYNHAALCFTEAMELAKKYDDIDAMQQIIRNITYNYNRLGQFQNTIRAVKDFESKFGGRIHTACMQVLVQDLLKAYSGVNDKIRSEECYTQIVNAIRSSDNPEIVDGYTVTIDYKIDTGQYSIANSLIKEAGPRFKSLKMDDAYIHLMRQKYEMSIRKKDYQAAIRDFKMYKSVWDSVHKGLEIVLVKNLERQYVEEADLGERLKIQNLKLLESKNHLQEAQLKKATIQTYTLYVGITLLGILLFVGYRAFRLKKKNNEMLKKQKVDIDQHNISLKRLVDQQVKLISEKEWLVREVNHRVKNNLQIIISLLNFQSQYLTDPNATAAIKDSQGRIRAMSLLHQQLYKTDNLKDINIENYITDLVSYLKKSLDYNNPIEFILIIEDITLDIGQVVPLGLILNEAITNALKYAFKDRQDPSITIELLSLPDGEVVMNIKDNGAGLPDNVDIEKYKSLGFTLMKTMAEQLDGTLSFMNNEGLQLTVVFTPDNNTIDDD